MGDLIIKQYYPERPVGVAYAFQHFQPYRSTSWMDRSSVKMSDRLMNLCLFEGLEDGHLRLFRRNKKYKLSHNLDFIGVNYYGTCYIKGMHPVFNKEGDVATDMGIICHPNDHPRRVFPY